MQKIIKYLSEVRAEFKNIAWPKKDTLLQLTFVVIAISVFISVILAGSDYLFTNSFGYLATFKSQPQIQLNQTDLQITPTAGATPTAAVTVKPSPNSKK